MNNLPKVVTRQRRGRASNPRLSQVRRLKPPRHPKLIGIAVIRRIAAACIRANAKGIIHAVYTDIGTYRLITKSLSFVNWSLQD